MDILMYSPFSFKAPSTYRLLSFAKVLSKNGHNVTITLPCFDKYSAFEVDPTNNINCIRLSKPFQMKTNNLIVNMLPYVFSSTFSNLADRYDVIHVLKPSPLTISGYSHKFLTRTPLIQDIDDLDHMIMAAEKLSPITTWVTAQSEKLFPRLADHIVVSCSALNAFYSQMGLKKRLTQISNGVFVDDYKVEKNLALKVQYKLKDNVIVYVGSLNNYAQLTPLIYCMKKIVTERKDVSCLILGDGKAKRKLQQLTCDLSIQKSITFTGRVSHLMIPEFLSIADIGFACFPSYDYLNYASNLKVFEYMAAGLPVVVSPTGDLPYYVNYGQAGVITNSDVESLSTTLLSLISDRRRLRILSNNARQYAKNFDWSVLTKRLVALYNKYAV